MRFTVEDISRQQVAYQAIIQFPLRTYLVWMLPVKKCWARMVRYPATFM